MKAIIKLLNSKNLEAYVCGGTARDIFLKRKPNNFNISVKTTLSDLQSKFTGNIVHVDDYNASVTIKFLENNYILHPWKKIELVNSYYNYSFTDDIAEDAKSRDFTINAMYYNPLNDKWIDPFDGKNDIKNKLLKFIGDPEDKIIESKIRLLRIFTLQAILGDTWKIENKSGKAITANKSKFLLLSSKTINKELINFFTRSTEPSMAFWNMRRLNILDIFFPELYYCIDVEQNKDKNMDLFQHLMMAMDNSQTPLIRLSALLHDIGKPQNLIQTNSGIHFYGHEYSSSILAEKILSRWGFNKPFINQVCVLVKNHLFNIKNLKTNNSIKKLILKAGAENIHGLLDLRISDIKGTSKHNPAFIDSVLILKDKINKLAPQQFQLNITDHEIELLIKDSTEQAELIIPTIKTYLKTLIIKDKLKNNLDKLKQQIMKINNINCPLDKNHLFNIWNDIETGSADCFPNGKLKCGIYCNFKCNNI